MLLAPATANAASPILEYEPSAGSLPVIFTVEGGEMFAEMAEFEPVVHCAASRGEGEITGPRSTVSRYSFTGCHTERGSHQKCKSAGAAEEEITAGPVAAELVWINQSRHEVGELLNPGGGTYIEFKCGGESAEGRGAFLAPVMPIDSESTFFTTTLSELASIEAPHEYEGTDGETLQAIPMGRHGISGELVTTGVQSLFTVHPSVAVEVRAITAAEVEASRQRAEQQRAEQEARQREQKQREEAEALAAAAATKGPGPIARSAGRQLPQLTVLKAKVRGHKLVLSLRLSTAGVVSVAGPSLKGTSKSLPAGVRRLEVAIVRRAHPKHLEKFTVSLRASSGAVSRTLVLRL